MLLNPAPSNPSRNDRPFVAASFNGQSRRAQRAGPQGEGANDEQAPPTLMDRNEELFFRNLAFLKDLKQANTSEKLALLNGDTELAFGIFPKRSSVSVAYSDGALHGMTMEVFFHPDVTFAPQPTSVARSLAGALLGEEYAKVSLVRGAGMRGVTSMLSELQSMLGVADPLPNLQRLARQSLTLGNSVVVFPQDAPFPLVRAALAAFSIVVAPRSSFDDEVGDHLQILIAAGALQQKGLRGLEHFHAELVDFVGERPASSTCPEKKVPPHKRADLRVSAENKDLVGSLKSPRNKREEPPTATKGPFGEQKERQKTSPQRQLPQDPGDRKQEATRIAELERALRESGQLL